MTGVITKAKNILTSIAVKDISLAFLMFSAPILLLITMVEPIAITVPKRRITFITVLAAPTAAAAFSE